MNPVQKLARQIVTYACGVQPGEKVLIEYQGDTSRPMARALVRETYLAGGLPFVDHIDMKVQHDLLLSCTEEQMRMQARWDADRMSAMDCFISIRGIDNAAEYADVPAERMAIYNKNYYAPVHLGIRIPKTRWSVTRYPSDSMAQNGGMTLEQLEDFYFKATTIDMERFCAAQAPLCDLMGRTDRVKILGPGTDLEFSIKGQQCTYDDGHFNIPCGEVGSAPILETLNGRISYNVPSIYNGFTFENIQFTLEKGVIVKATANDTERLNKILDTDAGARRIGEFSIGTNPYIPAPIKDTLFDEKMGGTFHFTPGNAYDFCDNGNRSAIHWDLVCSQLPEHGGGEIWFDGVLVRKDGRYVLPELEALNPENWA